MGANPYLRLAGREFELFFRFRRGGGAHALQVPAWVKGQKELFP